MRFWHVSLVEYMQEGDSIIKDIKAERKRAGHKTVYHSLLILQFTCISCAAIFNCKTMSPRQHVSLVEPCTCMAMGCTIEEMHSFLKITPESVQYE